MPKSFDVIMRELFIKFLKGKNPLQRELINFDLYSSFAERHPNLLASGFISSIDIALCDIAGKIMGQPIYNLFGGKFRERIRSYSYISRVEPDLPNYSRLWLTEPEATVDIAVEMVEKGFTALKLDPVTFFHPFFNKADENTLRSPFHMSLDEYRYVDTLLSMLVSAIGGRADLIIGTHGQLTTASAIRLAKCMEKFNPLWFEEPVPPENAKEIAKVKRSTSIPISTGERNASIYDFQRLLEEDAVSILQPDLGASGGITTCHKIATMAEPFYAEMAPHVWGGPIIYAAAVQIDASISNFLIQETIMEGHTIFFDDICPDGIEWKNGYIIPTDSPGLGITIDEHALRKHCI
jgi:2-dehydro-3-deoxyphosphogalactonate aldolase